MRGVTVARECQKCRRIHLCDAPIRWCFCVDCNSDHIETAPTSRMTAPWTEARRRAFPEALAPMEGL